MASDNDLENKRLWSDCMDAARAAYRRMRFADAEAQYQEARQYAEALFGPNKRLAQALDGILRCRNRLVRGFNKETEDLLRQAIKAREMFAESEPLELYGRIQKLVFELYKNGRAIEAYALQSSSLLDLEKALGPNHAKMIESLYLALVERQRYGQDAGYDADEVNRRLEIALAEVLCLEKMDGDCSTQFFDLAATFSATGRMAEAENLIERGLQRKKLSTGDNSEAVSDYLRKVSRTFTLKASKAEEYALLARQMIWEKEGPALRELELLEEIIPVYKRSRNFDEAIKACRRSIEIREASDILDLYLLHELYRGLAEICHDAEKNEDALEYYEKSISLLEEVSLNEGHDMVFLLILAAEHCRFAREKAEAFFKRALALSESLNGARHIRTGELLEKLAAFYKADGRLQWAEPLLVKAISIARDNYAFDDYQLQACSFNLASLYKEQRNFLAAERTLKAVLDPILEAAEKDPSRKLDLWPRAMIYLLAQLYFVQGDYRKAAPLLEISANAGASRAEETQLVPLFYLAVCYDKLNKTADAEPLYGRCIDILDKNPAKYFSSIANVVAPCVDFLRRNNQHEKADELLARFDFNPN